MSMSPEPRDPGAGANIPSGGEHPTWDMKTLSGDNNHLAARTFLRMVSHELRTPLNSIVGFSDILKSEIYGPLGHPQYAEYAAIISDSGRHLLKLFNNVLEIMRLETGVIDLHPAQGEILPTLEAAIESAKDKAREKQVRFDIGLKDADLSGIFDERALMICLGHLIENAIQHCAAGHHVILDARKTGGYAEIVVFNRGDAPEASDVPRLMQPFEQGGQESQRPAHGAGLGWAIVRLYAQAMGGEFRVVTRPHESLSAIIALPANA